MPASYGDVISTARSVALQGGPQAVSQFMASQGYPQNGAWCGEFAASVIKSVGGTPPNNPAVASNWRNFGVPADTPQEGDVAIRKTSRFDGSPVPTGQVGSHVTFVENIDPKTGMFTGLGGNQGAPESAFPLSQYEFRHPGDPSGPSYADLSKPPLTPGSPAPALGSPIAIDAPTLAQNAPAASPLAPAAGLMGNNPQQEQQTGWGGGGLLSSNSQNGILGQDIQAPQMQMAQGYKPRVDMNSLLQFLQARQQPRSWTA